MENKFCEYTVREITKRYKPFSKLTDDSAYFIGYMACGGSYISGKSSRNYDFMSVSSIDRYVLEGFRSSFCPDNIMYFLGQKSSEKVRSINDVWELRFPPRMNESFSKFGVFTDKNKRRVIGVSTSQFLPYMAGCIDSDGFISVTHRKDCRTPRLRFFITHASELFLADLQRRLDEIGVSTTLRQHGKTVYRLQAQNTTHNSVFLFKLYKYLRSTKKKTILFNYLSKYFFVPQASGELLESESQLAAEPSVHRGKVQRLLEGSSPLNNQTQHPNQVFTLDKI